MGAGQTLKLTSHKEALSIKNLQEGQRAQAQIACDVAHLMCMASFPLTCSSCFLHGFFPLTCSSCYVHGSFPPASAAQSA